MPQVNSVMSQEKLFKVAGVPMVENCVGGYNSCMFAYGQVSIIRQQYPSLWPGCFWVFQLLMVFLDFTSTIAILRIRLASLFTSFFACVYGTKYLCFSACRLGVGRLTQCLETSKEELVGIVLIVGWHPESLNIYFHGFKRFVPFADITHCMTFIFKKENHLFGREENNKKTCVGVVA